MSYYILSGDCPQDSEREIAEKVTKMSERPNLLYIQYDQQRYDCVSMSHIFDVKTPNLERIADNGAFFENCYTPIPVCAPARQALFSGRRPEMYGGLWNPHIVFPVAGIDKSIWSWTRAIREAGYNTAYAGCWEVDPKAQPSDYGFEHFVSRGDINKYISDRYPDVKYTNGFFGEPNPVKLEDSFTHQIAKHAIGWIEEFTKQDKPWYIHLDSPEPHLPCRPSEPFSSMYDPDKLTPWGSIGETFEGKPYIQKQQLINWKLEDRTWENGWKYTAAMYYGIISQYDNAVGLILDALERSGQMENTIIVYVTDHGDMCGGHRLIDKHYNMYDDITHIPMAMRWDGHIKPNRVKSFAQSMLDIPATLCGLMGIESPDGWFQGKDMSADLCGGVSFDGRDTAVSTYNGQQFGLFCERMICGERYKYVWNPTDIDEFYDRQKDPNELRNEIGNPEYRDIIADYRIRLHDELKRCSDPLIGWTADQLLAGRKI